MLPWRPERHAVLRIMSTITDVARLARVSTATESLEGRGDEFHFAPNSFDNGDVLATMFSTVPGNTGELTHVPTNTFFQLYFVPAKTKRERAVTTVQPVWKPKGNS